MGRSSPKSFLELDPVQSEVKKILSCTSVTLPAAFFLSCASTLSIPMSRAAASVRILFQSFS